MHGGEKSGTDAALRVLFELADRDDCAANQILENQVMVILPNQNPDGRDDSSRRNANGYESDSVAPRFDVPATRVWSVWCAGGSVPQP